AHQVADEVRVGLARLGVQGGEESSHSIPDLDTLPGPVREVFQSAFGEASAHLFLVAVPFAVVALVCVLLIKEVPLRETVLRDDELDAGVRAQLELADEVRGS